MLDRSILENDGIVVMWPDAAPTDEDIDDARAYVDLLDWSTNALAALFFAVSGAPSRGGNGARACAKFVDSDEFRDDGFTIFVIDPGAVNEKIVDVRGPLDVAADPERWSAYLNPMDAPVAAYAPICVLAPHVSDTGKPAARRTNSRFRHAHIK